MKRIVASLISSALLFNVFLTPSASGATNANTVALVCEMERLVDKEKLQFSVVLNETSHSVSINGTVFSNSHFSPYVVEGKIRYPYYGVEGVIRSVEYSLDRLTGTLHYSTLPVTETGEFSEEQKRQLASQPVAPAFLGTCSVSKPMF